MSAKSRQYWRDAEERWPELQQFLAGYLHQDWPEEHGSPEAAVEAAISGSDLARRIGVCRHWVACNASVGWHSDMRRSLEEGLGVEVSFSDDVEARQFMNEIYDRLIVSIRREMGKDWKP